MPLTARQDEILSFVIQSIDRNGQPVREIGHQLGIASANGVISHLRALERRSSICRQPRVPRGIVVLRPIDEDRSRQL